MTESTNRKPPTWDDYYKNEKIEKMPWYNEKLDFDLEEKLNVMQIINGIFLNLGTGLGIQVMQLSKEGFDVIGSDISETVIKRNKNIEILVMNKFCLKFLKCINPELPLRGSSPKYCGYF